MAFALEIPREPGENVRVLPNQSFRSGDLFRVILKPDFTAHAYLFGENPNEATVSVLYPAGPEASALQSDSEAVLPTANEWFRMDSNAGPELMILVVSTGRLPELIWEHRRLDRSVFESWLAQAEGNGKPKSQQVFQDDKWTRLIADASQTPLVIVHRIPLKHEQP